MRDMVDADSVEGYTRCILRLRRVRASLVEYTDTLLRRKIMNRSVILMLAVAMVAAVLIGGCRTGPSDEELIGATMADWKAALVAEDLDKVMAGYSENYASERGDGKEEIRQFMGTVFEQGWMDTTKVIFEEAETAIEGDKATFGPVKFTSDRGTMAIDYTLKKEDESWRIVSSKREE